MVFHWRRSSHLFYTPYVFSQCQTRVKLNHLRWYRPPPGHFLPGVLHCTVPRGLYAVGAPSGGRLSPGISTSLKPGGPVPCATGPRSPPTDTFPRVTTARPPRSDRGRAGSPRDYRGGLASPRRLPRTRLSRPRPPTATLAAGLAAR